MTTLLEARAVTAGYSGRPVVREVSLSLEAGGAVALVGPNAAGKSTFVRALAGEPTLLAGEVHLEGRPLRLWSGRDRARRLALVPQSAREDVDFTVRQMVGFGRAAHTGPWGWESARDREAVERALLATDVAHLADRPFGLLSGGERQRVLLARAVAQEAKVWLLDEPIAHLDLAHQVLVLELVRDHVRAGGAALVVLHDLAFAARLGSVAVFDAGALVACGAPSAVLTADRLATTWGVDGSLAQTSSGPALVLRGRAGG